VCVLRIWAGGSSRTWECGIPVGFESLRGRGNHLFGGQTYGLEGWGAGTTVGGNGSPSGYVFGKGNRMWVVTSFESLERYSLFASHRRICIFPFDI